MRIVEIKTKQDISSIYAYGQKTTFEELGPMEMIVAAIAKDNFLEIKTKSTLMEINLSDFSVEVILRKNENKAKSKIIETYLCFSNCVDEETKNKLQNIANKSHLKRMLSNEIFIEATRLKK